MLARKSGAFLGPQNFSSRATFGPVGHGLNTPVLGFWKNQHRFPYLKAAARELLVMTATSAPSERVFGVAATMLHRPEPTKERVEPKNLGITARDPIRPGSLRCCCYDFNVIWGVIGPVSTGGFRGLIPSNKAPSSPKLKDETLEIEFLQNVPYEGTNVKLHIEDLLVTVLGVTSTPH